MSRTLIVSADDIVTKRVAAALQIDSPGEDVECVRTPGELREFLESWSPSLIILDARRPNLMLAEELHHYRGKEPVLALVEDEQQLQRLSPLLVEEYLRLPFCPIELVARSKAARRWRPSEGNAAVAGFRAGAAGELCPFVDGHLRIDIARSEIAVDRSPVFLSRAERAILGVLLREPSRTVSARTIARELWGGEETEAIEWLPVFIRRLREKIEPNPSSPCYLVGAAGSGYCFAPQPAPRIRPTSAAWRSQLHLVGA